MAESFRSLFSRYSAPFFCPYIADREDERWDQFSGKLRLLRGGAGLVRVKSLSEGGKIGIVSEKYRDPRTLKVGK